MGDRRPDGPRLRARRHRRPHHADRRGPAARGRALAPAAATNPAVVSYDPAYGYEIAHIVKDGLRRMYGGRSARREHLSTTSPCTTSRTSSRQPEDLDVEGLLKGMYMLSPAADGRRRRAAQLLASGVGGAVGAGGAAAARPGLGRRRRRLVGDQLDRAEPGRPALRASRLLDPGRSARCRTSPRCWRAPGPGDRHQRLAAGGAEPDPALGAGRLRRPRRRRFRLLRHPGGRPAALPHRRSVGRDPAPAPAGGARRDRPVRARSGDREVRLHNVAAGTTGSTGGEADPSFGGDQESWGYDSRRDPQLFLDRCKGAGRFA